MAPAEGPVPAGATSGQPGGGGAGAAAPASIAEPTRTWFEREPALSSAGWQAARRLARRSRASWPLWVGAALLISGVLTARRAWAPPRYEVTTILRVSEGTLDASGNNLNGSALRSHVNELAFTAEHLTELIRRHAEWFRGFDADPVLVLAAFRDAMDVAISDNGFIEDRGSGDPPRAARIAVSFRAPTPEQAWTIDHELGELLIGSALEGQRLGLEREAAATGELLRQAQEDLTRLVRDDPTGTDPRVQAARERWRAAQSAATTATMAIRAASARQTLRFDLVDPGRKPEPQSDLEPLISRFFVSFLAAIMAGWLLAGAFDPRVVEAEDLDSIDLPVLGQLPLLPSGLPPTALASGGATAEGGRQRPRV
jgi:hypothetical protein